MDLSSAQDGDDPAKGDRSGGLGIIPAAVISATMQRAVNVALWQNHVPVLTELTLMTNSPEAAGEITINLTCEPPVIGPRSWHLQGVAEGRVRSLLDLDLSLDGKMLTSLTEGTRAIATFTATSWCGPIRRGSDSRSAHTRCGRRPQPTRSTTKPISPRYKNGSATRTSPPRGFTIIGEHDRRTAPLSKWPIDVIGQRRG
jgi:hypothetical protein